MGWLTPLVPHISGGRRGARWRIHPPVTVHGEVMAMECGDRVGTTIDWEWFRTDDALALAFDQRQVLIEREAARRTRRAEREWERLEREANQRRYDQAKMLDPHTYWWVATPRGAYRHAVRSFMTRQRQVKKTLCGNFWSVHACSVEELMLMPACEPCAKVIEEEQLVNFLREES